MILDKLMKTPQSSHRHLWADFIELLCLTDVDSRISQADALDYIRGPVEDLNLPTPLVDNDDDDEYASEVEDEYENDLPTGAELSDRWSLQALDWFNHIEYRIGAFGNDYPFTLSEDRDVLSLKRRLNLQHRIYLFLLLASNLRCISNNPIKNKVTSIFEVASFHALKSTLPDGSKVHMFGKHQLNRGYYSGKLWLKLKKLASAIGEKVMCEEEEVDPRDSGDGGLDLVAWTPIGDNAGGYPMFFAQCGCSPDDWVRKQGETSPGIWSNYLSFTAYPSQMTFIPFCFRKANGEWHKKVDIQKTTIVIDRVRLMYLLRGRERYLSKHITEIVDEVLNEKRESF